MELVAEGFVAAYHVEAQGFEDGHFDGEVYPGMSDEDGEEEYADAGVEGQYVADGHEWQA